VTRSVILSAAKDPHAAHIVIASEAKHSKNVTYVTFLRFQPQVGLYKAINFNKLPLAAQNRHTGVDFATPVAISASSSRLHLYLLTLTQISLRLPMAYAINKNTRQYSLAFTHLD